MMLSAMKLLSILLLLTALAAAQSHGGENSSSGVSAPPRKQPFVLIRGNGNVTVSGGQVSKHDQTIEMAQQLMKHCPEITLIVGDPESKPDYELLLNREGYGFFDSGESQIMLVRGTDKTVLWSVTKSTVARAVKQGCKAILSDWKQQHEVRSGLWNLDVPKEKSSK
jgi:hypothetical protein